MKYLLCVERDLHRADEDFISFSFRSHARSHISTSVSQGVVVINSMIRKLWVSFTVVANCEGSRLWIVNCGQDQIHLTRQEVGNRETLPHSLLWMPVCRVLKPGLNQK